MPGRPCSPEAGAATDPASAPVGGHGRQFRRGVDQPAYARLLRCFASFDLAGLHPSVTQRAALYGFHPQWVSTRPSRTRAAEANPRPSHGSFGGGTPSPRSESRASSRMPSGTVRPCPRGKLNWCFGVSMLGTLKDRLQGSQPFGNVQMSQDVSGRFGRYPGHRMPSPIGRKSAPTMSRQAARAYSACRLVGQPERESPRADG